MAYNGILRDIDRSLPEVRLKLKKSKGKSDKEKLYTRQLKALEQIVEYIDSYEWLRESKIKERIKFIREVEYDFNLIERELGMSYNAFKCFMYRMNRKLEEKIGRDTLSLVLSNKEENIALGVVNFRIQSGTYNLKNILLSDSFEILPKPKFHLFKIEDCKNEIKFLYDYSKIAMQFAYEDLNIENLEFLLYILTNETERYRKDQREIISLLQGIQIGIEEYMGRFKVNETDEEESDFSDEFEEDENDAKEYGVTFDEEELIDL